MVMKCILIAALLSLSAPLTAGAVCVPPPPNMVSWWGGDNNALDMAGTNIGTLQGGTTYAAGKVGQTFSFGGVNDYVDAGTNPAFKFGA